jgi:hypothetical protein
MQGGASLPVGLFVCTLAATLALLAFGYAVPVAVTLPLVELLSVRIVTSGSTAAAITALRRLLAADGHDDGFAPAWAGLR